MNRFPALVLIPPKNDDVIYEQPVMAMTMIMMVMMVVVVVMLVVVSDGDLNLERTAAGGVKNASN